MKKLLETLQKYGIEIPEEKQAELKKELSENYKNVGEFNKAIAKLETERDKYKTDAENATETLKGFEGVDVEGIKKDVEAWKKKAEDAEAEYNKKLADRDYNDALKAELAGIKFTSNSAKESIAGKIKAQGLTVSNGKILGLSDYLEQLKKEDAGAFVNEEQQALEQNKAQFTAQIKSGGKPMTKEDIAGIKDTAERRAAIARNLHLFK